MSWSIRARAVIEREREQRARERAARRAAAQAARKAFRQRFFDRHHAAASCGVSIHTWKKWQLRGQGPMPTKMGDSRQSRVFWDRREIARFLANPSGYNRARRAASKLTSGEPKTRRSAQVRGHAEAAVSMGKLPYLPAGKKPVTVPEGARHTIGRQADREKSHEHTQSRDHSV